MAAKVEISIAENRTRFHVGDTVCGAATVHVPEQISLSEQIGISFHCVGEVKWIEHPRSPHYHNGVVYEHAYDFYQSILDWSKKDAKLQKDGAGGMRAEIPFRFEIPKDKSLPSTMLSPYGYIQYYVRVSIQNPNSVEKEPKMHHFVKEIIVQSPIRENLMVTVGATAEKSTLLHGGPVTLHASIGRRGFAAGEIISVHVSITNRASVPVTPRIRLDQVQIFICGIRRHKTVQCELAAEPIVGRAVAANRADCDVQVLDVRIPHDQSLTIKCAGIIVKYFVRITVEIPHSFDLHCNLPVVITSAAAIENARNYADDNVPQIVSLPPDDEDEEIQDGGD